MEPAARMAAMLALAVLAASSAVGEVAPAQKQVEPPAGVCLLQQNIPATARRPTSDIADLHEAYKLVDSLLDRLEDLGGQLHVGGHHRGGRAARDAHASIGLVLTQLRETSESVIGVANGDGGRSAFRAALLQVVRPAEELRKGLDHLEGMVDKADHSTLKPLKAKPLKAADATLQQAKAVHGEGAGGKGLDGKAAAANRKQAKATQGEIVDEESLDGEAESSPYPDDYDLDTDYPKDEQGTHLDTVREVQGATVPGAGDVKARKRPGFTDSWNVDKMFASDSDGAGHIAMREWIAWGHPSKKEKKAKKEKKEKKESNKKKESLLSDETEEEAEGEMTEEEAEMIEEKAREEQDEKTSQDKEETHLQRYRSMQASKLALLDDQTNEAEAEAEEEAEGK